MSDSTPVKNRLIPAGAQMMSAWLVNDVIFTNKNKLQTSAAIGDASSVSECIRSALQRSLFSKFSGGGGHAPGLP